MKRRDWTATRLAEALSLNDSTVILALALLALPCTVQDRVEAGELAPSVAYEISKVEDAVEQARLADQVVAEKLTRAETVEAVKRVAGRSRAKARRARKPTSRVFRLAGYRVTVESKRGLDSRALATVLEDALRLVRAETGDPAESDAA
jgi:CO/xanthine dehydrogenase FAD-binding subunit